ncbi:hypothetical protein BHM03_00024262 [Ensete ventricosum]|nr:hypothetical protein BHM03_00024262 [Ensete ventricosum]
MARSTALTRLGEEDSDECEKSGGARWSRGITREEEDETIGDGVRACLSFHHQKEEGEQEEMKKKKKKKVSQGMQMAFPSSSNLETSPSL